MNTDMLWSRLAMATLLLAVGPLLDRPWSPEASVLGAQERELPLTLEETVERALEGNRELVAARARSGATRATARGAGAFRWPSLGAEAGLTRSDDPVAAFGTRLRQGRFTQADFALGALNDPAPVDDWTAGVGAAWDVLDPSAWKDRKAADARARASELSVERRAQAVAHGARVLYLQALQADALARAALEDEQAARATRDLLARRRQEGMLTDADVLRGEAALADTRARRVDAERRVQDARARLSVHLGLPPGHVVLPVDSLEASGDAPPPGMGSDLDRRLDLRASEAALDAARAEKERAGAARWPAGRLFGRVSSHGPEVLDGREVHTTLGVQVTVPLFAGGALAARLAAADAVSRAMEVEHEDRLARARAEVAEARRAVVSAQEALEAAEAARRAAAEASRLVRRRFEEGMATTADLLQAEAEATRLRTRAVDARAELQIARATLAFVLGGDTPTTRGSNGGSER